MFCWNQAHRFQLSIKRNLSPNQQHLLHVTIYITHPTEGRSHMRESPPQVRSGGGWRVVWTVEIQLKCIADVWLSLPHCCCCRTIKHLYSSHLRLLFFALCHRKTTLHFNEAKDKWRLSELRVDTYRRTSKPEQLLSGVQRLLFSLKRLVHTQNNIFGTFTHSCVILNRFDCIDSSEIFRAFEELWWIVLKNCSFSYKCSERSSLKMDTEVPKLLLCFVSSTEKA